MKNYFYILPLIFFFLTSCDKEDPVASDFIANISFLESSTVHEAQEIKVTIYKGTPCEYVGEVLETVSGNTFNYDFILRGTNNRCIAIKGMNEDVTVNFEPSAPGNYTLNFYINGKFLETRTVSVTE